MPLETDTHTHVLKTADGTILTLVTSPSTDWITIDLSSKIQPLERNTLQLQLNEKETEALIELLFQQLSLMSPPF